MTRYPSVGMAALRLVAALALAGAATGANLVSSASPSISGMI